MRLNQTQLTTRSVVKIPLVWRCFANFKSSYTMNTETDKLVTDLKGSSTVPNALLGINHWDKPNDYPEPVLHD